MPELPSHPESEVNRGPGLRPGRPRGKNALTIGVGIVLVVVFIVLHLTGVLVSRNRHTLLTFV